MIGGADIVETEARANHNAQRPLDAPGDTTPKLFPAFVPGKKSLTGLVTGSETETLIPSTLGLIACLTAEAVPPTAEPHRETGVRPAGVSCLIGQSRVSGDRSAAGSYSCGCYSLRAGSPLIRLPQRAIP